MKINVLEAKMTEQGITGEDMSKIIGVSYPTWISRKKNGDFSRAEINAIRSKLSLTDEETMNIFFAD